MTTASKQDNLCGQTLEQRVSKLYLLPHWAYGLGNPDAICIMHNTGHAGCSIGKKSVVKKLDKPVSITTEHATPYYSSQNKLGVILMICNLHCK